MTFVLVYCSNRTSSWMGDNQFSKGRVVRFTRGGQDHALYAQGTNDRDGAADDVCGTCADPPKPADDGVHGTFRRPSSSLVSHVSFVSLALRTHYLPPGTVCLHQYRILLLRTVLCPTHSPRLAFRSFGTFSIHSLTPSTQYKHALYKHKQRVT